MLGFAGVDLGLFAGRSEVGPATAPSDIPQLVARLRRALDEAGLTVADMFVQVSGDFTSRAINHPTASVRAEVFDQLLTNLDLAAALGAPGMTVLPGALFPDGWDASVDRSARTLTSLVLAAQERGLGLSVEPHIESLIGTVASTEELLARTPGLTLTLDHAHFIRGGEPQSAVDRLLPHARHLQVRGGSPTQLQASMADNVIDFRVVMEQLSELDYAGWVATEYVWSEWYECNRVDNLTETAALRDVLLAAIA
ncbi:MAG: TIM barrel protein [Actinomycetota bacterium]|nr:TIM barrel protein [Actinomycetota bacterium]